MPYSLTVQGIFNNNTMYNIIKIRNVLRDIRQKEGKVTDEDYLHKRKKKIYLYICTKLQREVI